MTRLRYIFGTIWVLFVWLVVAVIVGLIIAMTFPDRSGGDNVLMGIGPGWRNLPGTVLCFFAAILSWRVHVKHPSKKAETTPIEPRSN